MAYGVLELVLLWVCETVGVVVGRPAPGTAAGRKLDRVVDESDPVQKLQH